MRESLIITKNDHCGEYEIEIFTHPTPTRVIVCAHGNGVRRWDGEQFFYAVAEHYTDSAVFLVDQNQPEGNGVRINPLPVLVNRVDLLISEAERLYPDTPIVVVAHSMGCGVATFVDVAKLAAIVFVAPAAGIPQKKLIEKYGEEIAYGKDVKTSSGRTKIITAEYYESVKGISREEEYTKLVMRYSPVYVFEASNDEIVWEGRFAHRDIAFTRYEIISGARHNFSGQALLDFFRCLDLLI